MATRPIVNGRVYHLVLKPGETTPYALLPGDPGRVDLIASMWDEVRLKVENREYRTYVGTYRGVPVMATSTGIGGPSASIAIEELASLGVGTLIRVGTTGSLWASVKVGDLIIARGAVRLDGASSNYAPPGYPAVPHPDVLNALITAAEGLGVRYHVGLTASTDSFYVGQGRPGLGGYLPSWFKGIINDLKAVKVMNFDMETATVLTIANVYGLRAGSVMAVVANRETDEFNPEAGVADACRVANEAVKVINEWDRQYPDYEVKSGAVLRRAYESR
ncbi:uridine phosphorylase [Caldivirga maquilingensis]|uniref:Uridine phosphorylase n=1 Tax=Caldivirga maquilingensis (strain ATCC 700844 / DSM 13496 / JCM 10307 / IC-167) TaxID=397948 RepID=A8MBE8_CALMQ|nr:uridine phosphorylase [Caldivirga maquilingensis]ABW01238.1 uridine phosphorylase [Caldivirga maquilingensis IC-167]